MDFLQEARRWAGLSEEQQIPSSPPPPVSAPMLSRVSPPPRSSPPRTLGEAVMRAAQSEARALALQTALDRYVAQGEVMEVRAGGARAGARRGRGPLAQRARTKRPLT